MRRVTTRLPDRMWREVRAYAEITGVSARGVVDISAVVRDLLRRGLSGDKTTEAAYGSGYAEGYSAGYAAFMRRLAAAQEPTR